MKDNLVMDRANFLHIINHGEKPLRLCIKEAVDEFKITNKAFFIIFGINKEDYIDFIYKNMGGDNYEGFISIQ